MSTNLQTVKLIMVTSDNNKFYEMKENSDGTFKVFYRRVGGTPAYQTYAVRGGRKNTGKK